MDTAEKAEHWALMATSIASIAMDYRQNRTVSSRKAAPHSGAAFLLRRLRHSRVSGKRDRMHGRERASPANLAHPRFKEDFPWR
jgi:hypothetical protein